MVIFTPRSYQAEALTILERIRKEGQRKALVVMASGLGKTVLVAFDVQQWLSTNPNNSRVLFLCNQNEILKQARKTFTNILGDTRTYGYSLGTRKALKTVDILFASFQTMQHAKELFSPEHFGYIIVDESHHSKARTYREVIEYFTPDFLLGDTATPERGDLQDIREIYGPEVFSLPLEIAIARGLLAKIDYHVFTSNLLDAKVIQLPDKKVSTKSLNKRLFVPLWDEEIIRIIAEKTKEIKHPKMIVFCPSIEYANRFAEKIPQAVALHSNSKNYDAKMLAFREDKTATIISIDMFNEGVDIPEVNVIVFLRATSSPRIFLQQLGRGLRNFVDKESVLILDFVANCERIQIIYTLWTSIQEAYKKERTQENITIDLGHIEFDEFALDVLEIVKEKQVQIIRRDLIRQLQTIAKELGRTPIFTDIIEWNNQRKCASLEMFIQYFGNFYAACKAAKVLPRRKRFHKKNRYTMAITLTNEQLISALQEEALQLKRVPRIKDLREGPENSHLCNQLIRAFGSYNEALRAAGLLPNHQRNTEEELLEKLRSITKELGHPPTLRDLREISTHETTYARRFGSYNKALRAAGLQPNHQRNTEEELLEKLRSLAKKLGHTPSIGEVNLDPDIPTVQTICKRFGSLKKAFEEAGIEPTN